MKRVLIVEDDLATGRILHNVVRSASDAVIIDWYLSAEEALGKINDIETDGSEQYTLVISDITLAGRTSGVDLWSTYNRREHNTKFLFISGLPKEAFFSKLGKVESRIPEYLQKPISIEEAKSIILRAIS
jgi:DNA-binding NtrC family response regulator